MSTRGAVGFRINGEDKVTYNHSDSYPDGLGAEVINFIQSNSLEQIKNAALNVQLVNEEQKPTAEQIQECISFANTSVSSGKVNDWYVLLRNSQGNLQSYVNGLKYMIDGQDFLLDSLFCEYAYIINLDTEKLEFYEGFNEQPSDEGRYASICDKINHRSNKYYGVKLMLEIPLDDIRVNNEVDFVGQMNLSCEEEE